MVIGKVQKLKVKDKNTLTDGHTDIFLVSDEKMDAKEVNAFVFSDGKKLLASLKKPILEVNSIELLKVISKTKIGYFVDIGIEKDLLLPFAEVTERVKVGRSYPMYMYEDKTKRLAVSMKIKKRLVKNHNFEVNDSVSGLIYDIDEKGIYIAVDNKYDGFLPKEQIQEIHEKYERIDLRILRVLKTGEITLTERKKAYKQQILDSKKLFEMIEEKGEIPIGDKSTPNEIMELTGLSKKAFKRAIGSLYREKLVRLEPYRVIKNI